MPETKAKKTALTPQQLLSNPTRLVVSVSQAAVCLGIAKAQRTMRTVTLDF